MTRHDAPPVAAVAPRRRRRGVHGRLGRGFGGRQGGVSLIEALLALVVMSVGMLAVAGVQTTLRANGDLSRQRAEAVRLAQQSIEQQRGFAVVSEGGARPDYLSLVDATLTPDVVAARINTVFNVDRAVADSVLVPSTATLSPPLKTVTLSVGWNDRNAQAQQVNLFTMVARVAPELAGSLIVPPQGSPTRRPLGRQTGVPQSAEAIAGEDGKSLFRLPSTGDGPVRAWIFDNLSGRIERICGDADDLSTCAATTAQFVTGFLRLALPPSVSGDPAAMTTGDALDPRSTAADLNAFLAGRALTATAVYRTSSSTTAVRREDCVVDRVGAAGGALEYFCALPLHPVLTGEVPTWDGRVVFGPNPDPVADSPADASATRLRVCRYFALTGAADDAYSRVAGPLSQQNFVLARAGNGSVAYGCPGGSSVSVAQAPG